MSTDRTEYFRKYREENRERLNSYHCQWEKENPEKVKEYKRRYRGRLRNEKPQNEG